MRGVHLNLAYRWFCRLGLEDRVPDHSTFSKNRHGRFLDSDTFSEGLRLRYRGLLSFLRLLFGPAFVSSE